MLDNARVLVAGGTGFVGVNLIIRLLSIGAKVRATIHRKNPVIKDSRIEYVKCDLTVIPSDLNRLFSVQLKSRLPLPEPLQIDQKVLSRFVQ